MIYYCIAAIAPLLGWAGYEWMKGNYKLAGKKEAKIKWIILLLSILPMFLMFVLRHKSVGSDTPGYVLGFEKGILKYSFYELLTKYDGDNEIGYMLYVKLISLVTDNYTVFFLINAIIIFGAMLHFSIVYTKNPFLFFYLFITMGTYSFISTGLRQSLAIAICLLAVDFVRDKKLISFLFMVCLAYFFHKSALIFLLIYPLSLIKKYNWIGFIYIFLAVIFIVGFSAFHTAFIQLLGYDGYDIEETGNAYLVVLWIVLLAGYSFYILGGAKKEKLEQIIMAHFAALTVVFWLLRLISRTAERISFYFICGLYAYFSHAGLYNKDKLSTLIKWLLILGSFVLLVYRYTNVEYLFFWQ